MKAAGVVKVRIDEAACVGHGRCYALAPDVFDSDDHGHCVVLHDVVGEELADAARAGAANCPESAITVEDA